MKVRVYPGVDGDYRFTAFSSNGRAIVVSSEGYRNHQDALATAKAVWPGLADGTIELDDVVVL